MFRVFDNERLLKQAKAKGLSLMSGRDQNVYFIRAYNESERIVLEVSGDQPDGLIERIIEAISSYD